MDRCGNCQFYDRQIKGQGVGQCRRHAPALSPINAKPYMIEGVWPTVRDDDWCGEWKTGMRRADTRATEFLSMDLSATAAPPSRGGTASANAPSPLAALPTTRAFVRGND